MPPLLPGAVVVRTAADLVAALAAATGPVNLFLPPGRMALGGAAVVVEAGVNATLRSDGEGATLDAGGRSRVFEVRGALTLLVVRCTRGLAPAGTQGSLSGGGAIAVADGGVLRMVDCWVSASATAAAEVPLLAVSTGDAGRESVVEVAHTAGEHGGGLSLAATATATLVRTELTDLSAPVGAAVSTRGALTMSQARVDGAAARLAAIAVSGAGQLWLWGSTLLNMRATTDVGGLMVSSSAHASIHGSRIANGHAARVRQRPHET